MNSRTTVLIAVAAGLVGVWIAYKAFYSPWREKTAKLDADRSKTRSQLAATRASLGRIEEDWKSIEGRIRDPQRESLARGFDLYVRTLVDKTIADDARKPNLTPLKAERQGDFLESAVDAKNARFRMDEFVKFLVEIHNAREFLRLRRLAISSQYDRSENVVSVDFKASTLMYDPAPRGKP